MLNSQTALGVCLVGILSGCGDGTPSTGDPGGQNDPNQIPWTTCTTASYHAEQGRQLTGTQGSGFTLDSVSLGCVPVTGLHVEGAELVGTRNGSTVRGNDFLAGTVTMRDGQGGLATARINAVEPDPMDPTGASVLYTLVYQDPKTGAVVNACLPDPTGAAKALPLRGVWDATGTQQSANTAISLACTSGVLAKCVRWGYRPWETKNGVSLADYHQACTRMARADYCGDGHTYTMDGTPIDIYDGIGLLIRVPNLLSIFEGTWTTHGAYCIARERWITLAGLVPDSCLQQFTLAIESSPINPLDLCLEKRKGVLASDALLSDSTGVNIKL